MKAGQPMKKKEKVTIKCVGQSAVEVTGSGYLVECPSGERILLDCGLYQTAKPYETYKINAKKFDFKPKEVTHVIVSHIHASHSLMLGKLFDEGYDGKVYMSYQSVDFMKPMMEDCIKIMERDALFLSKKLKHEVSPIYTQAEASLVYPNLRGCNVNEMIKLTDNVSFKLIPSGHIIGACQVILYVKLSNGQVRKIAYSGDLGNTIFEQPFVEKFEPVVSADVFIGECTYNDKMRSVNKSARKKDIQKIKEIIKHTCIENKGRVLIPVFALQRVETMLSILYDIYGEDETFNLPIVVDSPLAVKLLEVFKNNLEHEDIEKLNKILEWKNVKIIEDYKDSMACIASKQAGIYLSSSGMLQFGRSLLYLKSMIDDSRNTILTCGYMGEGTVGWRIKNTNEEKSIVIDGVKYTNRCKIHALQSFSSHMQYEQLMSYYTNLANNGTAQIALCHSDKGKLAFKADLEENIARIGRTTKVIATNKDTIIRV